MTGLHRTALTTSQKIECAAAAVAGQGQWGTTTALSRTYEVSRPTVYAAGATARAVLERHFEARLLEGEAVTVRVDDAQLTRALVALRVVAPNSLRAIETLVPLLYPGVKVSYGKIQQLLVEAQSRAQAHNGQVDLSDIEAGALDEMFSQGEPVLAGVDLDGGFLFGLRLSASRDAASWSQMLRSAQAQGLELGVVVKDAASGIAAAVSQVYPQAEQRDDCFHVLYEMNKVRRRFEQRAYGAISAEMEAEQRLGKVRACEREQRIRVRGQWVWKQRQCCKAIADYDALEAAYRQVHEAMDWMDPHTKQLRSGEQVEALIVQASERIGQFDDSQAKQVAGYLRNRAPGLSLAIARLRAQLDELAHSYSHEALELGCMLWRLAPPLASAKRAGAEATMHLLGVHATLRDLIGAQRCDTLLDEIKTLLDGHHRASSAIEGFNAALRPYLYVHKGVTQGFLELFRAYFNLRIRRWGRHKGTSAHECLTGEPVADWLSVLGYPPSSVALS